MGHNNRTEEGDRLVASGMKLQGFVETGGLVRLQGFCPPCHLINGLH